MTHREVIHRHLDGIAAEVLVFIEERGPIEKFGLAVSSIRTELELPHGICHFVLGGLEERNLVEVFEAGGKHRVRRKA